MHLKLLENLKRGGEAREVKDVDFLSMLSYRTACKSTGRGRL